MIYIYTGMISIAKLYYPMIFLDVNMYPSKENLYMAHDAITIALRQIYHNIPEELLVATFEPLVNNMTLDSCIHENVIVNRVLPDINIYAGNPKKIMLLPEMLEDVDTSTMSVFAGGIHTSVYRIPPDARENKRIVAAIDVRPPASMSGQFSGGWPNNNACGSGMASALACNMLNGLSFAQGGNTPTVELISGDLIRLIPGQITMINWVLNCRLEYDEYFTNLPATSIRSLSDLIEIAVKVYIYNKLIMKVDRAAIISGAELGMFKSILETYSDQQKEYTEQLKKFKGTVYSSPQRTMDILKHFIK